MSFTAGSALAHPHVMVSARAALLIDASSKITGIRQIWTFDEAYSAYATTGFKKDANGNIIPAELEDLAKVNVESLKEFNYFTSFKQGREALDFKDPEEGYKLEFNGKSLVLTFILPLKSPAPLPKTSTLKIDDESFFVSFSYEEKDPITIEGNAQNCRIDLKKPEKSLDMNAMAKISEDIFNSMKSGFGDSYASSVKIVCP